MKPTKCPAKEKIELARKAKKEERRESEKYKSRLLCHCVTAINCENFYCDCCVEILLSAHAQNLQANILHLDQKAVKCTTCKWLYSKFWLFVVRK